MYYYFKLFIYIIYFNFLGKALFYWVKRSFFIWIIDVLLLKFKLIYILMTETNNTVSAISEDLE